MKRFKIWDDPEDDCSEFENPNPTDHEDEKIAKRL
jgi:hypothetical protein